MKKITRNTIKAFIRYAREDLYIKNLTTFDGMTDCVTAVADNAWRKADILPMYDWDDVNTLGIKGAWFVGTHGSKDYFNVYTDYDYVGYAVSNCCGKFVIAIKKDKVCLLRGQDALKAAAKQPLPEQSNSIALGWV